MEDVIIVGAGTVGSAMAYGLATDGRNVTVIERQKEAPQRIVGEILHSGGINALRELGMDDCLPETGGVMAWGLAATDLRTGRQAVFRFPQDASAMTLCNAKLVNALRKKAMSHPKVTFIEASVMNLIEEDGVVRGVVYKKKDADDVQELHAGLTILADGPFSRLRGVNIDRKPHKQSTVISFRFKADLMSHPPPGYQPTHPDQYCIPMYAVDNTAALINHINKDTLRYSTNIFEPAPSDERAFIKNQLCDLPAYIREPILACIDDVPIQRAHVLHLPAKPFFKPGVITIGDALNIRHPSTSSGMTVGLKDVLTWRNLLRDVTTLGDLHALKASHVTFMKVRKSYSAMCNINALAFGDFMFPPDGEKLFNRNCILEYLASSEKARRDMAPLLAIKDTNYFTLLYHLGLATIFTAYRAATSGTNKSPMSPGSAAIYEKKQPTDANGNLNLTSASTFWKIGSGLLAGTVVLVKSTFELVPMLWHELL